MSEPAGRLRVAAPAGLPRVPPGQAVARRWPVLHHGDVPSEAVGAVAGGPWSLRLWGAVRRPRVLTLADLQALGAIAVAADVHCVTGWSLLDSVWTGTGFAALETLADPAPDARFLMAHAAGGWSTNLSLEDCRRTGVSVVWARDGRPLPPEHGGPLRLLVPHLYFWKSAKWLLALEWLTQDRPGFWERDSKYTDLDPWHAARVPQSPMPC